MALMVSFLRLLHTTNNPRRYCSAIAIGRVVTYNVFFSLLSISIFNALLMFIIIIIITTVIILYISYLQPHSVAFFQRLQQIIAFRT